ncbi:MAG: FTR1 family protein [Alphaproteobacteria bacterium]
MLPTFLIFFREILEIAIILSVVLAATRGIAGRNRWVWMGIVGGLIGSALVAVFADSISESMEGMGQEIFNAGVLLAASFMIGWTVIWMQTHGRELAQKIKDTGKAIARGEAKLYSLAIIISLAMWREGAEIVLFMYGILSATEESLLAITAGGIGGTIAASALGFAIYLGLIKISTKYVFTVTSWMLILLACGMSAHAAGYLVAADAVPVLIPELWDTSAILSEGSMLGKILHAMLGYTERPSGIQGVFYVVTLVLILAIQKLIQPNTGKSSALPANA